MSSSLTTGNVLYNTSGALHPSKAFLTGLN